MSLITDVRQDPRQLNQAGGKSSRAGTDKLRTTCCGP
jgi:hypothetical protein